MLNWYEFFASLFSSCSIDSLCLAHWWLSKGTGKVSPKNQRRLNSAQSDSISTNFEYEEQKESALGILMNQPDNTLPFESWALRNAPSYITARRSMREAEARLLQVQQEINGNIASIYSEDYKNLALAASRSPQPGYVTTTHFANFPNKSILVVLISIGRN